MVVLIPESLKSFVSKPGVVHVILTAEPESSDTHVRTHTDTHNLFYVTVEDPRDSVLLPPTPPPPSPLLPHPAAATCVGTSGEDNFYPISHRRGKKILVDIHRTYF